MTQKNKPYMRPKQGRRSIVFIVLWPNENLVSFKPSNLWLNSEFVCSRKLQMQAKHERHLQGQGRFTEFTAHV